MKYRKTITKGTALTLSMCIASGVTAPIYASTNTTTASEKEEVIYCIADANGDVSDVEVVNIFDSGNIVDYGDYSNVKMLTTNDEITQEDDKITFSTNVDNDNVYYQGTLNNAEIPWDIDIEYYLDGELINTQDLAGKSGYLEIHFKVNKNPNYIGDIYDNYALEASFTLDRDLCKNIKTESGTIANVGNKKQITYTILPGQGIDTTISTNVHDFEMASASINGIRLNLNIDIDDNDLLDQIDNLSTSTEQLKESTTELSDGLGIINSNTNSLINGISSLKNGAQSLNTGIETVYCGMNDMENVLKTLNTNAISISNNSNEILNTITNLQTSLKDLAVTIADFKKLEITSTKIKNHIDTLAENITTFENTFSSEEYLNNSNKINELQSKNTETIDSLTIQINDLKEQLNNVSSENDIITINAQIDELQNIVDLLNANNQSITTTKSYANSLSTQITNLSKNSKDIQKLYLSFNSTILNLSDTLDNSILSIANLTNSVDQLVTTYENFSNGLTSYKDEVAKIVVAYNDILTGFSYIATGSDDLLEGSTTLSNVSGDLQNGISSLYTGSTALATGVSKLYNGVSDIDKTMDTELSSVIEYLENSADYQVTSFVSDKNTNVDSVQFVIKTDAIQIPEEVVVTKDDKEKLSFWQKLTNLF